MLKEFTLLYVEDNKDTQEYMNLLLKDEVKEFYQANNGEEGLKLFNEKSPDIIISDVVMPVLGGLEMSRKIKEINPDQIIILLSSLDDIKIIKDSIDIDINGYINKPILDIDDFLEKIYSKVSIVKYKTLKRNEDKMKSLLNVIKEVSHHWRQPLNTISLISSTYTFKYENNIEITNEDMEKFKVINSMIDKLSNVLELIEQTNTEDKDIDDLLNLIRISKPMYSTDLK